MGKDKEEASELTRLRTKLQDPDTNVRHEAIDQLKRFGSAAVPILIDTLHSNSEWQIRTVAAYQLGDVADKAAVPALTKALHDRDSMVREAAAASLGKLDAKEAVPALIGALDMGFSGAQIAETLGELQDPSAIPSLVKLVDGFGPASFRASDALVKFGEQAISAVEQRYYAADDLSKSALVSVLAKIGEPAISALLRMLLHAKDRYGRFEIIHSLVEIDVVGDSHLEECFSQADTETRGTLIYLLKDKNPEKHLGLLTRALQDQDSYVRSSALEALGIIADQSLPNMIIPLMSDPDPEVRIAAILALNKLQGRDFTEFIRTHLTDEDENVRTAASEVLGQITKPDQSSQSPE